ncbi:MAG: galactokinase [Lachnospiraceae bacterium]|nr:galactokinase [Lachnospiraceae bacterium]
MAVSKELKKEIEAGILDCRFLNIYKDPKMALRQKERYCNAIKRFEEIYGEKDIEIYSAPGRSEVMGNHTDHQNGEILAAGINLDAIAVVHRTDSETIKVVSGNYPKMRIDISDLSEKKSKPGKSEALIEGICRALSDKGYRIGGFEAFITSDVLIGAGLSSSAAFETLLGTVISYLFNDGNISATDIALAGQFAENTYFGKPCGLMDQMACSVGNLVHVDFADEKNPVTEKIEYDLSENGYSLCITDTKGSHAGLTDEYAAIPKEMKEIASFFGKEVLLGITIDDITDNAAKLREKYSDRALLRSIHFIKENERVRKGVSALKQNDTKGFLKLVRASGRSSYEYLQNVYTVKDTLRQDLSLALALSDVLLDEEEEAFRVHGGGFAGTIQAFVKNENVERYKAKMDAVFGEDSCHVLKIRKYGGIKVV